VLKLAVKRIIIIIIIIKGIYIAQVRKGHKCAMSAEMAVRLRSSSPVSGTVRARTADNWKPNEVRYVQTSTPFMIRPYISVPDLEN